MSEHDEQVALFQWADMHKAKVPALEMLYAIPNGGKRNIGTARKLKAEGVKAGVWDVSLDVPSRGFCGLKIEMKYGDNKLTDNQLHWKNLYEEWGYETAVCYSWLEAVDAIAHYLEYEWKGLNG